MVRNTTEDLRAEDRPSAPDREQRLGPERRATPAPPPPSSPSPAPWHKRRWVLPVAVVLGIILLIGGIAWIWYARQYDSTDDAFTQGHVIEVSTQVAGRVNRVLVDDNQDVTEGQLLVEIDPRDFESEVAQAQATLNVAQAEADRANAVLQRTQHAGQTGAVSAQDIDETVAAARKANAQVTQADAALAAAKLKLSYTRIVAPFAGRIARKTIEPGAYITPGQALMAVVDPHVWVEANFKETQLKLMKVGDPVRIKVDAFPHMQWHGHVESVQPGSGARFSLLPPENATGNFVKVVQRVPVKIVFDDYQPGPGRPFLGVGLSVTPRVTVR